MENDANQEVEMAAKIKQLEKEKSTLLIKVEKLNNLHKKDLKELNERLIKVQNNLAEEVGELGTEKIELQNAVEKCQKEKEKLDAEFSRLRSRSEQQEKDYERANASQTQRIKP